MIWALLGFYVAGLFGASGDLSAASVVESVYERIETAVEDVDRRDKINAILNKTLEELETKNEQLEPLYLALKDALQNKGVDRRDIDAALSKIMAARLEVQSLLLDMRFDMKDQMTRAEWAIVFPKPADHSQVSSQGTTQQ